MRHIAGNTIIQLYQWRQKNYPESRHEFSLFKMEILLKNHSSYCAAFFGICLSCIYDGKMTDLANARFWLVAGFLVLGCAVWLAHWASIGVGLGCCRIARYAWVCSFILQCQRQGYGRQASRVAVCRCVYACVCVCITLQSWSSMTI